MTGSLLVVCLLAAWAGATLLLAELRWFRRVSLTERLRRHVRSGAALPTTSGILSVASLRDVLGPLASSAGRQVGRLLGLRDELAVTLERVGSGDDTTSFRLGQFGRAGLAMLATAAAATAAGIPAPIAVFAPLCAAVVVYLAVEQRLISQSEATQKRLLLELPVVIEQLGMLVSSGHSLSGALARLAHRGNGVCAAGLRRVGRRIGQGLTELDALHEWAAVVDVAALDRLVGVLALNHEAAELGSLISGEARLVRREVHRNLLETIERRGQSVWIPVTLATLLPGVIFMAVPFVAAMNQITGT